MGTIILHAGAPKAGSSSIQAWLVEHAADLGKRHDIVLVQARTRKKHRDPVRINLDRYRADRDPKGDPNSGAVVSSYTTAPATSRPAIVQEFINGIGQFAEKHETVVVTSEAFALPFETADPIWLSAFHDLSANHPMRVAYYARPQHTALEAAWRQWGFRSGRSPSEFLSRYSDRLHYARTVRETHERAGNLTFELRPFRSDLLERGAVVSDFVHRFLGLEVESTDDDVWANRGLSLEVVNLLSAAPMGRFWVDMHDNRKYREIQRLAVDPSASGAVVDESRAALARYCHRVFEPGNQELIAEFGWPTKWFVAPPDDDRTAADAESAADDLTAFDTLWRPRASEAELAFLWAVLDRMLDRPE